MAEVFVGKRMMNFFFSVFVELNDEIISSFTSYDLQIFLLHQLKHVQEKKDGVNSIFAVFKYAFKGQCLFTARQIKHISSTLFHSVVEIGRAHV